MNGKLCCAAVVVLIGTAAVSLSGPYSVFDGDIVQINRGYNAMEPIGSGPLWLEAIEFSEDGYLYGVNSDSLLRINPLTGQAETIGPLGIALDLKVDLDENADGQLWLLQGGTGELFTIDKTAGTATLQCQADISDVYGLVILDGRFVTTTFLPDPQNPGCGLEAIYSPLTDFLEKGPDGAIHGLRYQPIPFQWTNAVFFRIDPTTGAHEELGHFFLGWSDMRGLTFDPTEQPPPDAIPTLGWKGLALLVTLLAVSGVSVIARVSSGRA